MAEDLVIIEAPGKRERLQRIINHLPGMEQARVVATRGLLFNLPEERLALDPDSFLPSHWVPVHPQRIHDLRKSIQESRRIWIATDPDIEGEMIAAQVARFLLPSRHPPTVHRVRFHSLAPETIARAFARPGRIDGHQAALALARRCADRYIGYIHSDLQENHQAGIVGRVHSRILHAAYRNPPVCLELEGTIDRRFRVNARATAKEIEDLRKLWEFVRDEGQSLTQLPTTNETATLPPPPPMAYTDLILAAEREIKLSPDRADAAMQRLYEDGRLSYLRTDSHDLGKAGIDAMERLASRQGFRISPPAPAKLGAFAHEALHPLESDIDLRADPRDLNHQEALLLLAGRALVASAMPAAQVRRTRIEPGALLEHLARNGIRAGNLSLEIYHDQVKQAGWQRLLRAPKHPAALRWRSTAEQIVRLMRDHKLGRPSTVINHVRSILKRRQILQDGRLSSAGLAALDYTARNTPWLLNRPDPVEALLTNPGKPRSAQDLVQEMLQGFGIEPDQARQEILRHTPDPLAAGAQAAAAR